MKLWVGATRLVAVVVAVGFVGCNLNHQENLGCNLPCGTDEFFVVLPQDTSASIGVLATGSCQRGNLGTGAPDDPPGKARIRINGAGVCHIGAVYLVPDDGGHITLFDPPTFVINVPLPARGGDDCCSSFPIAPADVHIPESFPDAGSR